MPLNVRKFFENGMRPDLYPNYRLIREENMDWPKLKQIVVKLDDISTIALSNNSISQEETPGHRINSQNAHTYMHCHSKYPQHNPSYNCTGHASTCNINNPIPCFCQAQTGVSHHIARQFHNYNPRFPQQNYPHVTNYNHKYQSNNARFGQPLSPGQQYRPQRNPHNGNQEGPSQTSRNNQGRYLNYTGYRQGSNIPNTRTQDGRPKCYHCNKIGHFATACRAKQNSNEYPNYGGRRQ